MKDSYRSFQSNGYYYNKRKIVLNYNLFKDVRYDLAVILRYHIYAFDVRLGDHEDVNGRLRCDIVKREYLIVLISLV